MPEVAETNAPLPGRTASDVVAYADHVVLVTAISERDAEHESAENAAACPVEPTVPRRIKFRAEQNALE